MTCIAIDIDRRKIVVIGGDSAGVGDLSLTVRKDRKAFSKKDESGTEWLFGFTTSFRMGELIQYELELPKITQEAKEDLYGFMITRFIPKLRGCLKKGGWAQKEKEQESGGTFIVSLLGRIFVVHGDYQVGEPADSFYAVGCGADLAKGSLYTSQGNKSLIKRVQLALEAAQRFSSGVREPFIILESGTS